MRSLFLVLFLAGCSADHPQSLHIDAPPVSAASSAVQVAAAMGWTLTRPDGDSGPEAGFTASVPSAAPVAIGRRAETVRVWITADGEGSRVSAEGHRGTVAAYLDALHERFRP